jgi:hypothetical protein
MSVNRITAVSAPMAGAGVDLLPESPSGLGGLLLEPGHVEPSKSARARVASSSAFGRDGDPGPTAAATGRGRARPSSGRRPRSSREIADRSNSSASSTPEPASDDRTYPVEEEDGAVGQDHSPLGRPRQRRAGAIEREVGIDEVGDLGQRCVPADRAQRHWPPELRARSGRAGGLAHLVVLPAWADELSQ